MNRKGLIVILLSIILFLITIFSISFGSVAIKPLEIFNSLFNKSSVNNSTSYIIRNMRMPRTFLAILAGSILALSGLCYQCVFRNPMADSYILGISSGASCFVALAFTLGISFTNSGLLPIFSLIGSCLTAVFLLITNKKDHYSLLLTGVATNFLLSAVTTLFVFLGKRQLDAIMFWTMGSFANSNWTKVIIMAFGLTLFIVFMLKENQALDILLLDDSTAISSGLNVQLERTKVLIIASALTALVVAYCGVIGFIGLMSPHIARLIMGPKHKKLIPVSMLFGSIIILLSDLISRTVVAPTELPVGIITSILGAPLFFVVLKRRKSWLI